MSTLDSTDNNSKNLGLSAFVTTAVNKAQLTRAQADISRLCELIAVEPEYAYLVWDCLRKNDLLIEC